jgi:hypothetical protein
MPKYRKGAEAKMNVANSNTFFLPKTSDSEAAGRLINMPGIVEAAATTPRKLEGVSKLTANGLRTGFLDNVELRRANAPITQNTTK